MIVATYTPFPLIYKASTLVLILVSLILSLKQEKNSKGFVLRYTTAFGWENNHLNDHFDFIEILPSTVLTPFVVFLHYKIKHNDQPKQKTKAVMILKDAMNNDDFRQLRVELKISGHSLVKEKS